ncbi:MAG: glycoside hydrolase family 3 protein [Eubacteriales bacterium]|nr:glycoside hydrolase family 3 protein [Eubacteriales bacterium]
MKKRVRIYAVLLALALLLSGCGNAQTQTGMDGTAGQTERENGQGSLADDRETAEADKSVYMDPAQDVESRVEALLAQMTLEEKIAQMVQPEQAGITAEDVSEYGFGSVLSGGGSAPSTGNSAQDWQQRVNELKAAALQTRLGIPLLYGVDAVHGNNNVFGTVIFPHNIGLGAAGDPELTERVAQAAAEEVRAIGVQWTFAPTLGNPQNERWGRTYECFSEDPQEVAVYGAASIRGFQGELGTEEYLDEKHVLACAKHFIGEGYTTDGINQGDVAMTQEEFDLLLESGVIDPYAAALNEGVRTVMISFNSVDGVKCHENRHLIRDILKGELGFTGLVVSDYNAIQQLSGATYKEQIRQGIDAGVDLFMEVYSWQDFMKNMKALVEEGSVSAEQIDDAVSRILRVKFEAGLFEETIGAETEQALLKKVGGEEHREIAREAVRKSLVLLKNETQDGKSALERLNAAENIRVCGQKAYDLGSQCGGWTISWQGMSGKTTQGTTIIDGIAAQVMPEKKLSHDVKGEVLEENDAVIVVIGEGPYAETDGDRTADALKVSADDAVMLENLKASLKEQGKQDIPVIAILIAGRPLNITEYLDDFDALIMAWLPGTEGEGVADVLFGEYDFTGKLQYTWMKDPADIEDKFAEGNEDKVLFPAGFGLSK